MIKKIDKEFLKFMAVGVINTAFGLTVMFISYNFFRLGYWVSSAANHVFGSLLSFVLNKHITFKNNDNVLKTGFKFILSTVVLYFISYCLAKPAIEYILSSLKDELRTNCTLLAGAGIFALLNFFSQKFFVFKKHVN